MYLFMLKGIRVVNDLITERSFRALGCKTNYLNDFIFCRLRNSNIYVFYNIFWQLTMICYLVTTDVQNIKLQLNISKYNLQQTYYFLNFLS